MNMEGFCVKLLILRIMLKSLDRKKHAWPNLEGLGELTHGLGPVDAAAGLGVQCVGAGPGDALGLLRRGR